MHINIFKAFTQQSTLSKHVNKHLKGCVPCTQEASQHNELHHDPRLPASFRPSTKSTANPYTAKTSRVSGCQQEKREEKEKERERDLNPRTQPYLFHSFSPSIQMHPQTNGSILTSPGEEEGKGKPLNSH